MVPQREMVAGGALSARRWHSVSDPSHPCGSSGHQLASERTATGHRFYIRGQKVRNSVHKEGSSFLPASKCVAWNLAYSSLSIYAC